MATDVASEFRDAVNDTINSLDIAVGNNLFRTRQELEILLGRIEAISRESTGVLFEELNKTERQIFSDLRRQTRELQDLERVTSNDLEALIASMSTTLASLPLASDMPKVFRFSPLFVSRGTLTQETSIQVSVAGALLSAEEPTLTIDGNPCAPTEVLDTSLKFLCDSDYFGNSDAIEVVTGDLSVYERTNFLDWLFFRDPDPNHYAISITVIPNLLGEIVPSVTIREVSIEKNNRLEDFSDNNGHCGGVRHKEFRFNAQEGWVVDRNSIEAQCKSSTKSSCNGLRSIHSKSFAYACKIENRGVCGPRVFGSRLWVDARGSCWGQVQWDEIKSRESLREEDLSPLSLSWGQDEHIDLPKGTRGVRLVLVKVNGDRAILTELEPEDPWVSVEIDTAQGFVVVRPKSLEMAMGH